MPLKLDPQPLTKAPHLSSSPYTSVIHFFPCTSLCHFSVLSLLSGLGGQHLSVSVIFFFASVLLVSVSVRLSGRGTKSDLLVLNRHH